jgi:hypothetical protein
MRAMDYSQTVAVNRLRKHLRVLEPYEKTDPYLAHSTTGGTTINNRLAGLRLIANSKQLESEIHKILQNGGKSLERRDLQSALREMLPLSIRVGESLAGDLIKKALDVLKPPPIESVNDKNWRFEIDLHSRLADAAIWTAANFGRIEDIEKLLKRFVGNLRALDEDTVSISISQGLSHWVRSLRKFGLTARLEPLLMEMTDVLLKGRSLEQLRADYGKNRPASHWIEMLLSLLKLAEHWIYFGWNSLSVPIVEEVHRTISEARARPAKDRPNIIHYVQMTCGYIRSISQMEDVESVVARIHQLLDEMDSIPNTTTAKPYFSPFHLDIVESIVLALVSDDFILGETARRFLDDDEYLIRRRIHGDLRKHLNQSGL